MISYFVMAALFAGFQAVDVSPYVGPIRYDPQAFLAALRRRDDQYDPQEHMVWRPYDRGSYHYHTAYRGNVVHPTRESLSYAVTCLDSGDPTYVQRGLDILDRVIALQDTDPESRTFGIWSWYLEEPLDQMDAPDFNWADFCGVQLLQVMLRHQDKLSDDLTHRVRQAILNACQSIRKRNVGPGYTNISLMGTYVTMVAGQIFGDVSLLDYAKQRMDRIVAYTRHHGCFTEFNSPTYSMVALRELGRMLRDVRDEAFLRQVVDLYRLMWRHIGRHFHEPTRQWAGPHSRAYRDLEGVGLQYFIQRATDGQIRFVPDSELPFDPDYARLPLKCPPEALAYFEPLREARQEIEVFFRGSQDLPEVKDAGDLPLVGTTYLHPAFALGTINRADFWNQRRPLILHAGTATRPWYARLRFLHDGYDFTSALFFSTQWKGRVLVGVNFATNYGDKHPSLDRVRDATIQAEDLRLRVELGGNLDGLHLPEAWGLDRPAQVRLGDLTLGIRLTHAVFGNLPIRCEIGRSEENAWIDVVLYPGPRRAIHLASLSQASLGLALAAIPAGEEPSWEGIQVAQEGGRLIQRWTTPEKTLLLSIPTAPGELGELQRQPLSQIDGAFPWDLAQSFEGWGR